jgi:hypothetical protein
MDDQMHFPVSLFCFLSSFPREKLPEIVAEDLEGVTKLERPMFEAKPIRPIATKKINFKLDGMLQEEMEPISLWKTSFLLEDLEFGIHDTRNLEVFEHGLKRSVSVKIETESECSLFDVQ